MQVVVITKRGEPLPLYWNAYYVAQNTYYPVTASSAEDVLPRLIGMYTFEYPLNYAALGTVSILAKTTGIYPIGISGESVGSNILWKSRVNYPVSITKS